MVSKSKILGQSSLILVTTGTTAFSYDRIFFELDKTIINLSIKPQVIVQAKITQYRWSYDNADKYTELPPNQLLNFIKKSDYIITHAGPGTLYLIAKYAKVMPLIIPRFSQFHEHVDNHQYFFANFIKSKLPHQYKKYILTSPEKIPSALNLYLKMKAVPNILNKYIFDQNLKNNLASKLTDFITQ
jgi:UDP-N-acetylglucosamine transferase subunit ALG13